MLAEADGCRDEEHPLYIIRFAKRCDRIFIGPCIDSSSSKVLGEIGLLKTDDIRPATVNRPSGVDTQWFLPAQVERAEVFYHWKRWICGKELLNRKLGVPCQSSRPRGARSTISNRSPCNVPLTLLLNSSTSSGGMSTAAQLIALTPKNAVFLWSSAKDRDSGKIPQMLDRSMSMRPVLGQFICLNEPVEPFGMDPVVF